MIILRLELIREEIQRRNQIVQKVESEQNGNLAGEALSEVLSEVSIEALSEETVTCQTSSCCILL